MKKYVGIPRLFMALIFMLATTLGFHLEAPIVVTAAMPPAVAVPAEPTWTLYSGQPITTNTELQAAISAAGLTATKIVLTQDILAASITVGDGQVIYITSESGSAYALDAQASVDDWRRPVHVAPGGTLFTDNILIIGGCVPIGGGGGVMIGSGEGTSKEAVYIMKGGVIADNHGGMGGGVYVSTLCTFYMLGGLIGGEGQGNHVTYPGELSAPNSAYQGRGGGVYTYPGGSFYMTGDSVISYNNADDHYGRLGSGVCIDGDHYSDGTYIPCVFNMTGGTITHNGSYNRNGGTGVVILGNSTFNMSGNSEISFHAGNSYGGVEVRDSTFNMYGGRICNNDGYYGGAVQVYRTGSAASSVFNMYGGIIGGDSYSEANVGKYPGVMVGCQTWGLLGGVFNMYGGKISHNDSTGFSRSSPNNETGVGWGGLFLWNYAEANIMGEAEISYNLGHGNAGCFSYVSSILNIGENAKVKQNVSLLGNGGGIRVDNASANIFGNAEIIGNSAVSGGGVAVNTNGTISISGNAKITGNTAESGGGIRLTANAVCTIDGGLIGGNTATSATQGNGGGILADTNAILYLKGGVISDNTACLNGGGMYVSDYAKLFLPTGKSMEFYGNNASGAYIAVALPALGDWSGTVASTSIDGAAFIGLTKDAIDIFVSGGNDIRSLIVFNNLDINMTNTQLYYMVTFESNGGTPVPPVLVPEFEKLSAPTDPSKSGNVFDGWFEDSGLINAWDFDTVLTSNITLYAKWKLSSYAVIVNDSYAGAGNTGEGQYAENDSVTIRAGTRTGHTFSGWTVNLGGITLANFSSATTTFTMPDNNVIVTANWSAVVPTPTVTVTAIVTLTPPPVTSTRTVTTTATTVATITNTTTATIMSVTTATTTNTTTATTTNTTTTTTTNTTTVANASTATFTITEIVTAASTDTTTEPCPPIGGDGKWALLNLILAIKGLLVGAAVIINAARKEEREVKEYNKHAQAMAYSRAYDRRSIVWLSVTIIAAVAGVFFFFYTENMSNTMVFVDKWTIVSAIIFIVGVVAALFEYSHRIRPPNRMTFGR